VSALADTHLGYGPSAAPAGSAAERLRTYAIVVYVLYLLFLPSFTCTMLIGVVVAYLKRNEARGTAFESHFVNAIDIFWVGLVVGLVATAFIPLFGLGFLIHAGLVVWILYRTVKGLIRAIEWQPYT
jgi:uncharacterized membrane protein